MAGLEIPKSTKAVEAGHGCPSLKPDLDIPKLTKEVEAGNGCPLLAEVHALSLPEIRDVMMQVGAQNKLDRARDAKVNAVNFFEKKDLSGYHLIGLHYPHDWPADSIIESTEYGVKIPGTNIDNSRQDSCRD